MNVLILSSAQDTGGQGVRMATAFHDQAGWTVRSIAKSPTYMNYPTDLPYRRRVAVEMYIRADVVHVRNTFGEYDALAAKHGPKPVIIHYHGTRFRADPLGHIAEQKARNAIGVASTLDLWLLAPDDLEWLPSLHRIGELEEMRRAERPELPHGRRPGRH